MNRFRFKSGLITERTAMALNDIAAWIEREERTRKGDSEFPTVERRRVKLTAHNGGTPPIYTGVEQSFTIAGVEEDKPNGKSFSPTNQPIYERNGQTVSAAALTAGYHCWVDRRTLVDGTPTYEFDIGNPSTSGSFTLAGRTGSQTINNGDTLTLNNGVVSATDTWTPDVASASLAGIVSTGTQTFAGDKSFLGDVVVNSGINSGNTLAVYGATGDTDPVLQTGVSGVLNAGVTLGGTTDKSSLNVYGQITHENNFTQVGNADHSLIHAYLSSDGTGNKAAALADGDYSTTLFINYQQSANTAFIQFGRGDPLGGAGSKDYPCFFRLGGSATGSSVQPRYEIQDTALVTHLGATGTSGGGDTVKGGLITTLGTPITTEVIQDAVGSILVSSSRISATYDDGVPSITHDLILDTITADYLHATQTEILFGRSTAGAGGGEEITMGTSMAIVGGVLDVDVVDGGTF